MPLSSRRRTFSVSAAHLHEPAACEEAREVLSEAEGRWWAFNLEDPTTLIILERKHIPDHLKELPNLVVAVTFQSLLVDLQDLGEAFRVTSGLLKFECSSPHRGSTLEEYSYSHSVSPQDMLRRPADLFYFPLPPERQRSRSPTTKRMKGS